MQYQVHTSITFDEGATVPKEDVIQHLTDLIVNDPVVARFVNGLIEKDHPELDTDQHTEDQETEYYNVITMIQCGLLAQVIADFTVGRYK